MNSRVFLNLKGGVGNQIFQIVAAINYCKLNDLDSISVYVGNLNKYGVKRDFKLGSLLDNLNFSVQVVYKENFWFNFRILNALSYFNNILFSFINEDKYLIPIKSKFVFLDGYFQAVKYLYLSDGLNLIKESFHNSYLNHSGLKKIFVENNLSLEFGLHIRGTDFLKDSNYVVNSPIKLIKKLNLSKIWVFTDDITYANKVLKKANCEVKYICDLGLSDFEEFILISMFNNFIISNSTYSLTAVILGISKTKCIWAPQKWVNSEDDNDNLLKIVNSQNFILY